MSKKISLCVQPLEFFKERVALAIEKNKLGTSETAEFYIVDLLNRFMMTSNLFDQAKGDHIDREPLAIQLLKAQESGVTDAHKIKILKKLGDTSLYISGFFGESLSRKVVDLEYYRNMGSIAYKSLSQTIKEESFHDLYLELYTKFQAFAEVLSEISHDLLPQTDQNLLKLYELYVKTGSEAVKKHLVEQGLTAPVLASAPKDKINKN